MAKQKYQKVRFTGKRTGLDAIAIRGHGIVQAGDTITVPAATAEHWMSIVKVDDKGGETSDWAASGDVFSADEDEITEQLLKEREKITNRAAEADDDATDESALAETFAEPASSPADAAKGGSKA